MFRRIVICLIIVTLNCNSIAWAVAPNVPDGESVGTYESQMKQFDDALSQIEELRTLIDRSQFDLGALLDELDYDPDKIVSFVTNDIYYQQYAGSLRGAAGTLMSKSGNALDQSVLLAKLLHDAGYDARIAEGSLPTSVALQLVRQHLPQQQKELKDSRQKYKLEKEAEVFGYLSRVKNSNFVIPSGQRVNIKDSPSYAQMLTISETLTTLLGDAQDTGRAADIENTLIEEATRYYWVEMKPRPSDPWTAIHVLGDDKLITPDTVVAEEYFSDSLPERLVHRIGIEVIIEQKLGDKLVERPVIDPWIRPAANLHGKLVTFTNVPNTLSDLDAVFDLEAALNESSTFVPLLLSGGPSGGQPFDLEGNVVDKMAGGSPAVGLFSSVADRFGTAAGGIDAKGDAEDFVALVGEKIKFTFYSPGGSTRVEERSILDVRDYKGPGNGPVGVDKSQTRVEQISKLTEIRTFSFNNGYIPDDYILEKVIDRVRDSRLYMHILMRKSFYPDEPFNVSQKELENIGVGWLGAYLTYVVFDANVTSENIFSYRADPNLLIHHGAISSKGQRSAVDVVRNDVRMLSLTKGRVQVSFDDSVRAGVWETVTEGLFIDSGNGTLGTNSIFTAAAAESIPTVLLTPSMMDELDKLQITEQSKAYARRDLVAGYNLAIPRRTPNSVGRMGWWRIDPINGTTLGMLDSGEGTATTEDKIIRAGIIAGVMGAASTVVCLIYQENERSYSTVSDTTYTMRMFGECLGVGLAVGASVGVGGTMIVASGVLITDIAGVLVAVIGLISTYLVFESTMRDRRGE